MPNLRALLLIYTLYLSHYCSAEEEACSVVCKASGQKKPVCASDRQSYPSKCEVRRQRICLGKKNLEWIHEGECKTQKAPQQQYPDNVYGNVYGLAKTTQSNCTTKRLAALEESRKLSDKQPGTANNLTTIMIPTCKQDGSYDEVQCHPATRYCWCVTPRDGKPVPDTSVLGSRPNCGDGESKVSQEANCSDTDRAQFNSNILLKFSTEYDEVKPSQQTPLTEGYENIRGMSEENSKIAAWKFNSMDTNNDKQLSRHELKGLKRLVRKNVKPKGCAKAFIDNCDKDSDSYITEQEWGFCLGGNTRLSFRLFLSLNAVGPQEKLTNWGDNNVLPIHDETRPSKEEKHSPELMEHQKRLFDMLSGGESRPRDLPENSRTSRNDAQITGANDRIDKPPLNDQQTVDINRKLVSLDRKTCNDERIAAMNKGSDNNNRFIPSCQSDGRYEPTQCHMSSGYCWCVNPNSGVPIPGTSRLKEQPSCSNIVPEPVDPLTDFGINSIPDNKGGRKDGGKKKKNKKIREIPGCPAPNHGAFLTQLVDKLALEMASAGGSLPAELTNSANMSLEEKAIRWKVITADRDGDKKLNKKEMKFVRHMVKQNQIKAPEKCGKKFMRYCDKDKDDYLTVDELLVCTEVRRKAKRNQRKQSGNTRSGSSKVRHRNKERNPFTDILMPSPPIGSR